VTNDPVARGARVERLAADFRWPGGRRVGVVFNVAFEAWSDGKAPGIGPMGNPLPSGVFDTNALSWGHYGAARGMERLLRLLDRTGVTASVMTSGVLAERAPDLVRATAQAGHEIVGHAYAQDVIPARLSESEQRHDIARTTALLQHAAGSPPVGWISPRGTPGTDSARLLAEAGYAWHGDAFDDDLPYLQTFAGVRIVAIPLTMELNDLPHAMRFGRSPREFVQRFEASLSHAQAADETVLIDVTAHAHVYGRPDGAWAFEAIARDVMAQPDVWCATRRAIAEWVAREATKITQT
jgi:peptidoglycan/xylan/chitin deacetylase (PgdA/CDA1 family)